MGSGGIIDDLIAEALSKQWISQIRGEARAMTNQLLNSVKETGRRLIDMDEIIRAKNTGLPITEHAIEASFCVFPHDALSLCPLWSTDRLP